jgi:hypothetical protein
VTDASFGQVLMQLSAEELKALRQGLIGSTLDMKLRQAIESLQPPKPKTACPSHDEFEAATGLKGDKCWLAFLEGYARELGAMTARHRFDPGNHRYGL